VAAVDSHSLPEHVVKGVHVLSLVDEGATLWNSAAVHVVSMSHTLLLVGEGATVSYMVAVLHTLKVVHSPWLLALVKEPSSHGAHTRSESSVGYFEMCSPTLQSVNTVQARLLVWEQAVEIKVPAAHELHMAHSFVSATPK
jgi:hypothetical protein